MKNDSQLQGELNIQFGIVRSGGGFSPSSTSTPSL